MKAEWEFPLKEKYDRINHQPEEGGGDDGDDPFCPPPPPEDGDGAQDGDPDGQDGQDDRGDDGDPPPPVPPPAHVDDGGGVGLLEPDDELPVAIPPRPGGYDDYVLDKRKRWCKADAKGRLMPVDQSGTIIRNRTDPSPMARPKSVNIELWELMTPKQRKDKIKQIEEERKAKHVSDPDPGGGDPPAPGGDASPAAVATRNEVKCMHMGVAGICAAASSIFTVSDARAGSSEYESTRSGSESDVEVSESSDAESLPTPPWERKVVDIDFSAAPVVFIEPCHHKSGVELAANLIV